MMQSVRRRGESPAGRSGRNLLRQGAAAGVYLLVCVPLVVIGALIYPAMTGKGFAFRIITELVFVAWAVLALRERAFRPRGSYILWSLTAFMLVIGAADVFGVDPRRSFWSTLERMDGYVTLLHVYALFIVAGAVLRTERAWRRLFVGSVTVSVWVALLAAVEFLFATAVRPDVGYRAAATLGNPAFLATYLVLHVFIAAWLIATHRGRRWGNVMLGLAVVLLVGTLTVTGTRGAVVGLLGGLTVAASLAALRRRPRGRGWVGVSAVAVIATLGLLAMSSAQLGSLASSTEDGVGTPTSQLSRDGSSHAVELSRPRRWEQLKRLVAADSARIAGGLSQRLTTWGIAAQGLAERPLLGWGQENFEIVAERHYDPALEIGMVSDRPHNVLAQWAVAGGLAGLFAYLCLYASAAVAAWKRGGGIAASSVLLGLLSAWMLNHQFLFDTVTSYVLLALVLAYLHRATLNARVPEPTASDLGVRRPFGALQPLLIVLLVVLIGGAGYWLNAAPIRAALLWHRAVPGAPGGIEDKIEVMELALATGAFQPELRRAMLELAGAVYRMRLPADVKERTTELAIHGMERSIAESPERLRPHEALGRFLAAVDRLPQARVELEEAVRITPRKQHTRIALVSVLDALGESPLALESARLAYEVERRQVWPRQVYSAMLLVAGETDLAIALLGPQVDDRNPNVTVSALLRPATESDLQPSERDWLVAFVDSEARRGRQYAATVTLRLLSATLPRFALLSMRLFPAVQTLEAELYRRRSLAQLSASR